MLKNLIVAAISLFICWTYPFTQVIDLTFDGTTLSMTNEESSVSKDLGSEQIDLITASLQKTLLHTPGIRSVSIVCANGKFSDSFQPNLYLVGRDLFGNLKSFKTPEFKKNFNDWATPRHYSDIVQIYNQPCKSPAKIHVEIVGRGEHSLTLSNTNAPLISVHLSAGFIDKSIGLCAQNGCDGSSALESIPISLKRIASLVAELLLYASLINILLSIFSVKDYLLSKTEVTTTQLEYSVILLVAIAHFAYAYYFQNYILGAVPHISDSAIYFRQGVLLAHGLINAPLPALPPFEAYLSNSSHLSDTGIVYQHANHFWPLLIAIFYKLGAHHILGAFLSSLSCIATYVIARRFFNLQTALFALLIYAASPFAIINAGDFMMHAATSAFFWLGAVFLFYGLDKNKRSYLLISGALLCYAFAMRQLTTVSLLAPLSLILITQYSLKNLLKSTVFITLGALPFLALYFIDNKIVIDNYFASIHKTIHGLSLEAGNFRFGISHVDSMLGYLSMLLWYTPIAAPLFASFLFVGSLKRMTITRLTFLASATSLIAAHSLLNTNAMHGYGPRLFFEALPAIALLIADGLSVLMQILPGRSRYLGYLGFLLVVVVNIQGSLQIFPLYRGYNALNERLVKEIKRMGVEDTLFVVEESSWQEMDTFATLYDPYQKNPMVIKKLPDNAHQQIIDKYLGKRIFEVTSGSLKQIK